jgi:ferritin-like metal-binding protein YciE
MGERLETLTTYVGDMHALEKHLLEAFEKQLSLTENVPHARTVVQQLVNTTRQHVDALEQRVRALGEPGKNVTDVLKTAVAGLAGVAAGAIDWARPQSVSKALRDSYTATNHAIISYIMLQTTGVALNDPETASLARQHLADCVSNAQAIANVMPSLVVKDLSDDVGNVSPGAATEVTGNQNLGFLYHGSSSNALGS